LSDFEIEISGDRAGYRITARSAAGEAAADAVVFPLDGRALERDLAALEMALLRSSARNRRVTSELERPVQDLGQKLFDFVLPPELRANWFAARQQAVARDESLSVRLRIGPPELLALPWEVLYDSSRDDYLSLSSPVVRSLDVFEPLRPLTVAPPLQVLAMAAEPAGLAPLDVQHERLLLTEALALLEKDGRVRVTWVQGQTWQALQTALDSGSWHVLHFVGHGGFDRSSGEGVIALAGDDGELDELPASDLGTILAEKSSLRLVVLNSCDGARGSTTDRFSSTASVLLRRGIPAVVAMQYEISDDAAKAFAQGFYTALAGQHPIDKAVTRARLAIKRASRSSLEWATPVMYLRAAGGSLFDITDVPAPPSSTALPPAPVRPSVGSSEVAGAATAAVQGTHVMNSEVDDGPPTKDQALADHPQAHQRTIGKAPGATSRSARRRRVALLVGIAAAALVAVVVAVTTSATGSGRTPDPSLTAAPTSLPGVAPAPVPSEFSDTVFADDFSGSSLDPEKWRTPPLYPDNIRQSDGHLALSVRPGKEADYAKLETQPLPRPFTEATFVVTVPPYDRGGDGGASFVINGSSPQPQRLAMGPSVQGGVYIEPETCDKPSCRLGVYEDFTQPDYSKAPPLAFGEAIPIKITREDGHLIFYAKGVEIGRTKDDPGLLGGFWFAVSSGGGDSWDVHIDDLVVR
jgi:CHAT domain-containing protein